MDVSKQHDPRRIAKLAELGRQDLLVFLRDICDYDWVNEEEHRTLCDFLMNPLRKRYSIIAAPRDTLKTTIVLGYSLWVIVRGKVNIRILLDSEIRDSTKARLQGLKDMMLGSWKFKACYGDMDGRPKENIWNAESATLSCRKSKSVREATYETAGVDVVTNSRHYDLIIPDDLHSEKNSQTRTQIQKVKDHLEILQPLLDPKGEFILVCTWWDDKDANRQFMKLLGTRASVFIETCYRKDAKGQIIVDADGKNVPRYPCRLPLDVLEDKRRLMTTYKFACQYLLDPVAKENAMFAEENIGSFKRADLPRTYRRFLTVDPAGDPTAQTEEKRDSDYYALPVVAVSPGGSFYLLDVGFGRFNPTEGVEEFIRLHSIWSPHVSGIERTGLGNMKHHVEKELRKLGKLAMIEDLTPRGRSKTARVSGLEPIIRLRKFYIAEECPHREEIIEQIVRFTRFGSKAEYDDIPDAIAYVIDLIDIYGTALEEEPATTEDEWDERLGHLTPESQRVWRNFHKKNQPNEEAGLGEFL